MEITMSKVQQPTDKKSPIVWHVLGSIGLGTLIGGTVDSFVYEFGFDVYFLYTCAPVNIPISIIGVLIGWKLPKSTSGRLIGMWAGGIGLPILFAFIIPFIAGMLGMT